MILISISHPPDEDGGAWSVSEQVGDENEIGSGLGQAFLAASGHLIGPEYQLAEMIAYVEENGALAIDRDEGSEECRLGTALHRAARNFVKWWNNHHHAKKPAQRKEATP